MPNRLALTGAALAAVLVTGTIVAAQDSIRPVEQNGRFTMIPAEEGFVRLDTETGIVSHCRRTPAEGEAPQGDAAAEHGPWRCVVVEDDARNAAPPPQPQAQPQPRQEVGELDGVIASEIASLSQKVARLTARLDALEKAKAPEPPAPPPRADNDAEEMDRALDFSEELMRRFFGMVREMKRETEEDRT